MATDDAPSNEAPSAPIASHSAPASEFLVGRTISHFHILDLIGKGGMGVVYRARDQQLRRDVAIKVLSPEAIADESARKRFRHEALTLSRLNHPNIETVLGFETLEGLDLLIVEYVAGHSLEARLQSGPLPEEEAVAFAMMVADALEAAHEKGVVHCDLKPSNIGLTPDGRVKVLDFGIAQVLRPRDAKTTLTLIETRPGAKHMVGGTLPYMAPEQLLGRRVDRRVDLYAVGVVLFQMVVGHTPFHEPLATALVEDILHKPPPRPRTLNHHVSPRLEEIILRCLEKDPADRYQTAADLRADLGRLKKDMEQGTLDTRAARSGVQVPRGVLYAGAALTVAIAVLRLGLVPVGRGTAPQVLEHQVTFTGRASEPAVSPDGQYVAYREDASLNRQRLLVQDLAGGEPLQILAAKVCFTPRWSPDGSSILCYARRDTEFVALMVPRFGGTPRSLTTAGPAHSWAPDGRRFVSASARAPRLVITEIATGDTSSIPLAGFGGRIADVDWSPRGDRIVVLGENDRGRYSFWTVVPGHPGIQKWFEDSTKMSSPRWSPTGDAIYFFRSFGDAGLKDLCRIRWTNRSDGSAPKVLLHGLPAGEYFTLSKDGRRLVYTRETARANLWLVNVQQLRRDPGVGQRRLTTATAYDESPSVSPDGAWIAFARVTGRSGEIFRIPVAGGAGERLTFLNSRCQSPVWSPAGDTIAFLSDKGGLRRLWRVPARGGPARACSGIEISDRAYAPIAWAPGSKILCSVRGDRDYLLLDPRTGRTTRMGTSDSIGWITYPQFSPQGARIAWWSLDPKGMWVMDLGSGARARVFSDGPVLPLRWTSDGRALYALDWRGERSGLLRVTIHAPSREERLEIGMENVAEVAVSPDGRWAVYAVGSQQPDVWLAEGFDPHAR